MLTMTREQILKEVKKRERKTGLIPWVTDLEPHEWAVLQFVCQYHPEFSKPGIDERVIDRLSENGIYWAYDLLAASVREAKAQGVAIEQVVTSTTVYDVAHGRCVNEQGRPINEVYKETCDMLERIGLYPDEYFSLSAASDRGGEFPYPYRWVACYAVTGGSEGHYLHVDAIMKDGSRKLVFVGKTLQEGKEGMDYMYRICAALAEYLGA